LIDPTKRIFCFGLVATAATLVLPASEPLEIVSARDMRIPLQLRPGGDLSLAGIRYHQLKSGLWLGLDRHPVGYADIVPVHLDIVAPTLAIFERETKFYDKIKERRPNLRSKDRAALRNPHRKLGL